MSKRSTPPQWLLMLVALWCLHTPIGAQTPNAWPQKPIHLVVPYPAGGAADLGARIVSEKAAVLLGQPILVDNRPGANGNIGTEFVRSAIPDGYTLLLASLYMTINPLLDPRSRYTIADFTPAVLTTVSDYAIVVSPGQPYQTLNDLIQAARRQPNEITVSNPGNGSPNHLAMELLALDARLDFRWVNYKGQPQAILDMMQDLTAVQATHLGLVASHLQTGKLRALAVSSPQRLPSLPNVPTMAEAGWAKSTLLAWSALMAPKGTPDSVLQAINRAYNQALASPEVRAQMDKHFMRAQGGSTETAKQFLAKEQALWADVVRKRNIHLGE